MVKNDFDTGTWGRIQMKQTSGSKVWILLLMLVGLLVLDLAPLAHAGVGLEYLGPNPLRPQPVSGQPNTLGAGAIVGNSGNDVATITFTLLADQGFSNQFIYSISDNNFTLSPGTRQNFALTFTFNPTTIPVKNYSARISIVASPTSTSGTSGSASFDLDISISAGVLSSNYNGVQVTLTTGTGIVTVTTPNVVATTTPTAVQTNSLATNSLSSNGNEFQIDPNLLIGGGIGALAILLAFVISNRRRNKAIGTPIDKPMKPEVRSCISCGTRIRLDDKFCDSCGANQGD